MKLMVCGSRTITDIVWIFKQINTCIQENNFSNITIIEGEAKGVDTFAKKWAERHSCLVEKFPADWNKYGKAAGFIRNELMVKACDFCLILWDGNSKGTKHDIDLCNKLNKPYKLEIFK